MSVLKTAVLRQIAYARSVRSVIRAIMRRMLDGEWINRIFASSDEEFNNRLDEAFKSLDIANATKRDFCGAVVDVLCDEVSDLCLALKDVCEGSGYSDYYVAHISHERFVRLVLSVDTVKLGKMKKILEDASRSPIDILRGIGAVLNDEPIEERATLGARERCRANAELKAIAADVKDTMQSGFKEVRNDIASVGAKVDAVGAKVSKCKHSRQRHGKYDETVVSFCVACIEAEQKNAMLVKSGNGKPKMEDVFARYRSRLKEKGVEDFSLFKKIVHAYRARESRDRVKKLEARKTAAQQKHGVAKARPFAKVNET